MLKLSHLNKELTALLMFKLTKNDFLYKILLNIREKFQLINANMCLNNLTCLAFFRKFMNF